MKKITMIISLLLIAALVSGVFSACGIRLPAAEPNVATDVITQEQTDPAPSETEAPETREVRWSYNLRIDTTEDAYDSDDGVRLASTTYERPVLELVSDGDAEAVPPEAMQTVCGAFNERFDEFYNVSEGDDRYYWSSAAGLGATALEQYEAMDEAYRGDFFAYWYNVSVSSYRLEGDLIEIALEFDSYTGGAHGAHSTEGFHFDLQEGAFFELSDLTDAPDGLAGALADEISLQIVTSDEADEYFPGYGTTIKNYGDYKFMLGDDSLTVIFGEYEIAPYAMGPREFVISYDKISRFLNEKGARLLFAEGE